MWLQFILENAHFALFLFSALVIFAIGWLYFDAGSGKRQWRVLILSTGFILLSLSYLLEALILDNSIFIASVPASGIVTLLIALTRILGYCLIIISQLIDPIQPKPKVVSSFALGAFLTQALTINYAPLFYPVLAAFTGFLYLRRASIGFERHLREIGFGFIVLGLSGLFSLRALFENTDKVYLSEFAKPFGVVWYTEHLTLLAAVLILGHWVRRYLFERLQTQLFMYFNIATLVIFLLTTITFTFLLLKNLEAISLQQIETNAKMFNLNIESKKSETLSDAEVVAQNSQVIKDLKEKSHTALGDFSREFLLAKKESSLIIIDANGRVMARGEDKERNGDSFSEDPLFKRIISGTNDISTITVRNGAMAPEVTVKSAVVIKDGAEDIGVVMAGSVIDNAFLDGIKKATGLDVSVYGNDQLSATTITAIDGSTRPIGIREEDQRIKTNVLQKGGSYTGSITLFNVPYSSTILPLKDVDNNPAGMIFVGQPEYNILQTAGRSIELTFIITAVLLVLSIIPAFIAARSIAYQVK